MSETLPAPSIETTNTNIDHSMDNWNAFKAQKAEEARDKSMDNWNAFKAAKVEEARDKSMDNWNAFKAQKAEEARDKSMDNWNAFLVGKTPATESIAPSAIESVAPEAVSATTPEAVDNNVEKESQNESVIQLNILAEAIAEFDKKVKSGDVKLKDKEILDKLNETFQDIYDEVEAAGVSDKTLENVLESAYPAQKPEAEKIENPVDAFNAVKTTTELAAEKAATEIIDPIKAFEAVEPTDKNSAISTTEATTENKKLSEKIVDGWYGLGAAMTGLYSKIDNMIKPERKTEETDEQYEKRARNRKVLVSLGALAGVLVVGYEASQLIGSGSGGNLATDHSANAFNHLTGSGVESVAVPVDATPMANAAEFSSAAQNVNPGEGFYQTFKDMGIPKEEWGNLVHKVGPALQKLGLAYPDGDSFGISNVGQLPKSVLELIQNSR